TAASATATPQPAPATATALPDEVPVVVTARQSMKTKPFALRGGQLHARVARRATEQPRKRQLYWSTEASERWIGPELCECHHQRYRTRRDAAVSGQAWQLLRRHGRVRQLAGGHHA